MEHYTTVTVPETTERRLLKVTCDICGKELVLVGDVVDDVEVTHATGERYSDAGFGAKTIFDLCGDCFENALVPWLRSQGAEPRTEEWDY